MTTYTDMKDGKLLQALGADAQKWAQAFNQHAVKLGYSEMDEGWLIGWFANAIEHSWDVRTGNLSRILPDGSAFFVANVG